MNDFQPREVIRANQAHLLIVGGNAEELRALEARVRTLALSPVSVRAGDEAMRSIREGDIALILVVRRTLI